MTERIPSEATSGREQALDVQALSIRRAAHGASIVMDLRGDFGT